MKPLIAILSCHQRSEFREACRTTWLREWNGLVDYKFFLGEPSLEGQSDEVFVPTPDNYQSLPLKLYHTLKWALVEKYTHVFKCDDDTYVHIPRLLASGFEKADYMGARRSFFAAGGAGYWVSDYAMQILTTVPERRWSALQHEDMAVGDCLVLQHQIFLHGDVRYIQTDEFRPVPEEDLITTHKCGPQRMTEIHAKFKNFPHL